jgi:hypothetical protein
MSRSRSLIRLSATTLPSPGYYLVQFALVILTRRHLALQIGDLLFGPIDPVLVAGREYMRLDMIEIFADGVEHPPVPVLPA